MLVQKRFVSLIEMMIVMFLIALILGVVAYNYRGSLEEGKAFKTRVGIEKIEDSITLALSKDPTLIHDVSSNWRDIILNDPIIKDPRAMLYDGWGEEYQVNVEDGTVRVSSRRYEDHLNNKSAAKRSR